jgi:hypothetical protein
VRLVDEEEGRGEWVDVGSVDEVGHRKRVCVEGRDVLVLNVGSGKDDYCALDSVCYRTTRHDTTRHDTTRHDTTRHDTTRHTRTQLLALTNATRVTDFGGPLSEGDIEVPQNKALRACVFFHLTVRECVRACVRA